MRSSSSHPADSQNQANTEIKTSPLEEPNIEPSEEANDFSMEKQLKKMRAKISLQQREETILQEIVFQLEESIAEKKHTHQHAHQLQTQITDTLNHEKDHHGALIRVASAVSHYGKFFRGMNQQNLPSAIIKIIELGNNHIIKKVTTAQIPDEKQEENKHETNEDVTSIPVINT